eukprot:1188849-Prorocentrum_minimum.AAC.1
MIVSHPRVAQQGSDCLRDCLKSEGAPIYSLGDVCVAPVGRGVSAVRGVAAARAEPLLRDLARVDRPRDGQDRQGAGGQLVRRVPSQTAHRPRGGVPLHAGARAGNGAENN